MTTNLIFSGKEASLTIEKQVLQLAISPTVSYKETPNHNPKISKRAQKFKSLEPAAELSPIATEIVKSSTN
jgi:hypothetical protein